MKIGRIQGLGNAKEILTWAASNMGYHLYDIEDDIPLYVKDGLLGVLSFLTLQKVIKSRQTWTLLHYEANEISTPSTSGSRAVA